LRVLDYLRFDYEGLFAIRPARLPGFSLPGKSENPS
jgi:hypothetical protein